VLVIEDDYLARISDAPYVPIHHLDARWVVVRSFSKVLGPDLRLAIVAGDEQTIARVEGRQHLGPGWVSHILQQIVTLLLHDDATAHLLQRTQRAYAERRRALVAALHAQGIPAHGESGLGVWVPLVDEAAVVSELLVRGWAVSPGERYRFRSAPGIRITTTSLELPDAEKLAHALAAVRRRTSNRSYAG
jgi:DNA-binding transcriptional MocR family regulator